MGLPYPDPSHHYGFTRYSPLVVDNAISHVEQMASFTALVKADPQFATSVVPVGNGEFLAVEAFP